MDVPKVGMWADEMAVRLVPRMVVWMVERRAVHSVDLMADKRVEPKVAQLVEH